MTQSADGPAVVKGKDLFCPRDGSGMVEQRTGEATLDVCKECSGQFFDAGEMFQAFGLTADPSYWDRPETGGVVRDSNVTCPRCKSLMLAQDVTHEGQHVEVDRCRRCHGVWLDGGEVHTIMVISRSMAPVIEAEKAKAKEDLARIGEADMSAGLIGRFFALFTKG